MPVLGQPARLIPFFGYRNRQHLVISGRALRAPAALGSSRTAGEERALLSHFASKEHASLPVTLTLRSPGGQLSSRQAISDGEGFVHFSLPLDEWPLPARTEWETVEFAWTNREGPQIAEGYVLAPGTREGRLAAIFIRCAGGAMSEEEIAAKATIEAAGAPLWLGESYAVGEDFLAAVGVTPDGATTQMSTRLSGTAA